MLHASSACKGCRERGEVQQKSRVGDPRSSLIIVRSRAVFHMHAPPSAETTRERRGSRTERKHRSPGVSTRRRTSEPKPSSIATPTHEPPRNRLSGVLRNWLGMLLIGLISWPAKNGCRGIHSRGFSGVSPCILLVFLSMQTRRAAAGLRPTLRRARIRNPARHRPRSLPTGSTT